jgi:L-asparaginase
MELTPMLPNVKILATGGTIAGSANSSTQMTNYEPGVLKVEDLLAAVPEVADYAHITAEQVSNLGSHDIDDAFWLLLAEKCRQSLASPNIDGLVLTHGTNTLEETAYFLNLVVNSHKPVVVVGSMRPGTAVSADGPLNLLNAVRLAGNRQAAGRGVLIALNDQINGARDTSKTNTSNTGTFRAPDLGLLGYMINGEAVFYRATTRKHTAAAEFEIGPLAALPQVEIIYGHANQNRVLVDAAVNSGAQGIVYAGMGMGAIHKNAAPALIEAQKKGVVVVRGSRTGSGIVPFDSKWTQECHFVDADNLNPQKARILLMLALTKTNDYQEIQRMFGEY